MGKLLHIINESTEQTEGYNQRNDETYLEKAFKEGYECGYKKAMKETEGFDERRPNHKETFEDRIERLRNKYK